MVCVQGLRNTIASTNHALRRVKLRLETRLGLLDDIVIEPFRSWATDESVHLHGRVLEAKGISHPDEDDSLLRGIANTIRRLDSDEIPQAGLSMTLPDAPDPLHADDEGYFRFTLPLKEPLRPGWHRVRIELVESIAGGEGTVADAEVLVPDPAAQYCVVSDLDDTVVVTGATDRLRMMRIILTKDARERSIFPGVDAFYRALRAGKDGYPENAFFYITRTGWNLYDLFIQIMERHEIPPGAMLMQELAKVEPGADSWQGRSSKEDWLEQLFGELPHRFVLVGDSGQRDPEMYLDFAERRGDRIAAIFIRDVTTPERDRQVHTIADRIGELGIPVSVTGSTGQMARDAVRFGLIEPPAVDAVERAAAAERERNG